MKKLILFLILFKMSFAYAQEVIILNAYLTELSLEDTSEYKYVSIDTDSVWYIAKPQKVLLSMPSNLGDYALITDTNQYYPKNSRSSFQFKLYLDVVDFYLIEFYQKYDFELKKDGGIIETSYDNGETWQNLIMDTLIINHNLGYLLYDIDDTIEAFGGQPGFTGTFSEGGFYSVWWQNYSMIGDTMLLRFTFASDSNDTDNEGWLLDGFRFGGGLVPIDDPATNSALTLYPNPASSYLSIKTQNGLLVQLDVLTTAGTIVYSKTINGNEILDISSLKPGIYFIRCIENTGRIQIFKIIKT